MEEKELLPVLYFNEAAINLENRVGSSMQSVLLRSAGDAGRFLKRYLQMPAPIDVFLYGDINTNIFELLRSSCEYVIAAGGLIRNANGKYLIIKRFGVYDLPKGKLKKKEDPATGALREVTEETGVTGLEIRKTLTPTFHLYQEDETIILKMTHWFLMQTSFTGELLPETEEEITEVKWLSPKECKDALNESYRSLRENLIQFIQ